MKLERLLEIIMIMVNKDKVTAKELAEKFEVSVRTIQRDIDSINMAGIPIVSLRGNEGGYQILEGYKMDKNFFTEAEYGLLKMLLKSVNNAYEDRKLESILEKFENVNNERSYNENVIMDFSPWGVSEATKEKVNNLKEAIHSKKRVYMEYVNINGIISSREIEPIRLILKVSTWYVYGYCCLKNDYRLFKLSRIMKYEIREEYDREHEVGRCSFSFPEGETISLKLKFNKKAVNLVYDYFDSNEIEFSEENIIVKVNYREDEWVYGMLMSFGENVEVLEPNHVREEIILRHKNTMKIYE